MKKILILLLVFVIGWSLPSCMMMMPGHMSGSMNESHNHNNSDMKTDPVCGKRIVEENSLTYEYQGKIYYFDSEECLSVFKSNPVHFLQKQNMESSKNTMNKVGLIGGGAIMTALMIFMMYRVF